MNNKTRKLTRKALSILLSLTMIMGLMPVMSLTAVAVVDPVAQNLGIEDSSSGTGYKTYTTLQGALEEAVDDQTVQLLRDIQENVTYSQSSATELDLNGHSITSAEQGKSVIYIKEGKLTVTDSKSKSTEANDTHYYKINETTHLAEIISKSDYDALGEDIKKGSFVGGYITGGTGTPGENYAEEGECEGGGIFAYGGCTLVITGGTVIGNKAASGGGISAEKGAVLKVGNDVNIIGNYATGYPNDGSTWGGFGGGVYKIMDYDGVNELSSVSGTVKYNTGIHGGGVAFDQTAATLTAAVEYNTAKYGGGVWKGESGESEPEIYGAVIRHNSAEKGGGFYSSQGYTTISNGTEITYNSASELGGGVYLEADIIRFSGTGPVIKDNGNTNLYMEGENGLGGYSSYDWDTEERKYIPFTMTGEKNSVGVTIGTENGLGQFTLLTEKDAVGNSSASSIIDCFFSDNSAYMVKEVGGELHLVANEAPVAQNLNIPDTESETGYKLYRSLQEALDAVATGQTVQLLRDAQQNVTYNKEGITVTMDLNGHNVIGVADGNNAPTIRVEAGTLKLDDSSEETVGKITHAEGKQGGGVYIASGATFIMDKGEISGNNIVVSTNEGSGAVQVLGSFTMNGGAIKDNTSDQSGVAVYVNPQSTFTMTGGEISGNRTSNAGCIYVSGSMIMTGGEIKNNVAYYGSGIWTAYNNERLTFGGNAKVVNNHNNDVNNTPNNVQLFGTENTNRKKITISTDTPLTTGARIGVTLSSSDGMGVFTSGIADKTSATSNKPYFFSDADHNVIIHNQNDADKNQLELGNIPAAAYTAPTEKELTYNGTAQPLINAGSSNEGTIKYSLSEDGEFSTDIPTATNAGDHTVYYKVFGDDEHADTAVASITVKIAPAKLTVTAEAKEKTYGEEDPELTYTVAGLQGNDTETDILTGAIARESGSDVAEGGYNITQGTLAAASDNYVIDFKGAKFTIKPKSIADAVISLVHNELVYTGSALSPTIESVMLGGTKLGENDFGIDETSDKSAANYGTYTLKIKGKGNYTGEASKIWKITKTLPEVNTLPSATPINYGTALNECALTGGKMVHGNNEVAGSYSWSDPTIVPTVAESNVREFEVIFNPTDTANFDPITIKVKVTVIPVDQAAPNVSKTDETIKGKKDGSISGLDETMEYREDGEDAYTPVTDETLTGLKPGKYFVRRKGDENHNLSPDAAVVVGEGATITVVFDTDGGSAAASVTGLSYNDKITEPDAPLRDGFYFAGWFKDKDRAEPWDFSSDSVTELNTTLYAKWSEIPTYKIHGVVYENDGTTPKGNVEVSLIKGKQLLVKNTTGDNGQFEFIAADGIYNIVAVDADGITKTELVEIAESTALKIVMPAGNTESRIDNTSAGDFEAVAGGLDEIAAEEKVGADEKITMTLVIRDDEAASSSADKKSFAEAKAAMSSSDEANGKALDYFDLSITKTVTNTVDGSVKSQDTYAGNSKLINIRLATYNTAGKSNVSVIRYVNGKVEEVTAEPNKNGEYVEINDDGTLTLCVKELATYAVLYDAAAEPTVKPRHGGGGGGTSSYAITAEKSENGKVKPSVTSAVKGKEVKITASPDEGYELDKVTVTDKDGNIVEVTKNADGTYSFIMPASKVTITSLFKENASNPTETPEPTAAPVRPVASPDDTGVSDMLITEAHIVYIHGYDTGDIRPTGNITRAETAAMFYRLLKDKDVEVTVSFKDVPAGTWFSEGVGKLASLGILSGYEDGTYAPENKITRAEFTSIAARFAKATGGITDFTDVPVGFWASESIATAFDYGWINGYKDDLFAPDADITRAEAAVVVNKMIGRSADKEYVDAHADTIVIFPDLNDSSAWYYYDLIEAITEHDFAVVDGKEIWN